MAKSIKPFKVGINSWKIYPTSEPIYNENGREILRVAIGETIDNDEYDYIYEDIYKDVLSNLFLEKQGYKVQNSYGHIPNIIITSDNDIVPHNPMVSTLIDLIKDKLSLIDEETLFETFIEMKSTREKKGERKGELEKKLYQSIYAERTNLSYDLIFHVLSDIIISKIQLNDYRKIKEKVCPLSDLKAQALRAFYNDDDDSLESIKNNLLFRLMYSQIKEAKGDD